MKAEQIKAMVTEFLSQMGFDGAVNVEAAPENVFLVKIQSADSKLLIGKNGEVLGDFQAILNKMTKRKGIEDAYIDLDVNGYKEEKSQFLKGLAKHYAQQVMASGQVKEVDGFSAYERRVIHTELKKYAGVVSESKGDPPNRILIVKPAQ